MTRWRRLVRWLLMGPEDLTRLEALRRLQIGEAGLRAPGGDAGKMRRRDIARPPHDARMIAGEFDCVIVRSVGRVTRKLAVDAVAPSALATAMVPVVAPVGTRAEIVVVLLTVKAALVPLKLTEVTPTKLVPVMVTVVPAAPLVGAKPLIVWSPMTTKVPLLALPFVVVTRSEPLPVAPVGIVIVICVALLTV